MISAAAVWIQGGWRRRDSSSVTHQLSMIYHFVSSSRSAQAQGDCDSTSSEDSARVYWMLIRFRLGKEFTCMWMLNY